MKGLIILANRKSKLAISISILAIVLFTLCSSVHVMAAEDVSKSLSGIYPSEFELEPTSTNDTTYFISDTEFSFNSTNISSMFYVPKTCNCRMTIAVIAQDRASENITIGLMDSSGNITNSKLVATNKAAVYVFENVKAGNHSLKFTGRSGMTYVVRISLYTWDY